MVTQQGRKKRHPGQRDPPPPPPPPPPAAPDKSKDQKKYSSEKDIKNREDLQKSFVEFIQGLNRAKSLEDVAEQLAKHPAMKSNEIAMGCYTRATGNFTKLLSSKEVTAVRRKEAAARKKQQQRVDNDSETFIDCDKDDFEEEQVRGPNGQTKIIRHRLYRFAKPWKNRWWKKY